MREAHTLRVVGKPAPQGSKSYGRGGRYREASRYLPAWRKAVVSAAMGITASPLDGPLACSVVFLFARPPSHLRKGGELRKAAPQHHVGAPDTDKLCRSVGDALTIAGLILDDRLIVRWAAEKRWAYRDEQAGALITVIAL